MTKSDSTLWAIAALLLAAMLSGCGPDTQIKYARGVCISGCIDRHLDEMTDADHANVDVETYRAVADVCRELFACAPCAGNSYTLGDFGTCEIPGTLKAPEAIGP